MMDISRSNRAGNSYSGSLPKVESGSFHGATGANAPASANYFTSISNTNSQGLTSGNYTMQYQS